MGKNKISRRTFLKILSASVLSPFPFHNLESSSFVESRPQIYLTIDDGPQSNMEKILLNLKGDNKATFFLIGNRLGSRQSYLVRKAIESGHTIGNHSYSHPQFSRISEDRVRKEIESTEKLISAAYSDVGKEDPKLFRFPFGDSKNHYAKHFLEERDYRAVRWDLDTFDWKVYSKKFERSIADIGRTLDKAKHGDIILAHDNQITADYIVPYCGEKYVSRALA